MLLEITITLLWILIPNFPIKCSSNPVYAIMSVCPLLQYPLRLRLRDERLDSYNVDRSCYQVDFPQYKTEPKSKKSWKFKFPLIKSWKSWNEAFRCTRFWVRYTVKMTYGQYGIQHIHTIMMASGIISDYFFHVGPSGSRILECGI